MSKVIRLSLELTLQNPQEVSDLINMLQPFATAKTEEAQPEKPVTEAAEEEKPKKPRKPRKTAAQKKAEAEEAAKLAAAKEAEQKESEEAAETKEEPTKAADTSEVKIEDVRALLAKKVGSFRSEIKAKLTELEAKNVTNLDKSKYGEFMDFLNSL